MAGKKVSGKRRGGLANFGEKRAAPFGKKGSGSVPKGGYKPSSKRASSKTH